jgi:hypothetical protein
LGFAGLAQISDTSKPFGLFAAARIIKRRDNDDGNRRSLVPQSPLKVEAGHPAKVYVEEETYRG